MKCPECGGNNAFETDSEVETLEEYDDGHLALIVTEYECYDCGALFKEEFFE